MTEGLEVWLDADFLPAAVQVGMLVHDRGAVRFNYAAAWLEHPLAFELDPDLSLHQGTFHPQAELGNFRIFDDSAPDRWGQMLMKRREALAAKDQGRPAQTLYAWDFLVGVQDLTRQGALRLRRSGGTEFLAADPLPAPPVTSLRELESVARQITARRLNDLDALRRWLALLMAPGASLGGARPKANFTHTDGSLWIAKFPARDDERDLGAWEGLIHALAMRVGISVPPAEVRSFSPDFHTYCVRRFDRTGGKRHIYASAMAMLRKDHSEGTSYIEIAEFLHRRGARKHIASDLEQMFRRVAFNVAVGNRDDHLRNHGFILTPDGWRLAPAFDVNPNVDRADHVLNLDESDARPSLLTVIDTAEWYALTKERGAQIAQEILELTRRWRSEAERAGISRADIELTATAFAQSDAHGDISKRRG